MIWLDVVAIYTLYMYQEPLYGLGFEWECQKSSVFSFLSICVFSRMPVHWLQM